MIRGAPSTFEDINAFCCQHPISIINKYMQEKLIKRLYNRFINESATARLADNLIIGSAKAS